MPAVIVVALRLGADRPGAARGSSNPGADPATVTRLTGITDAMVQGEPAIADLVDRASWRPWVTAKWSRIMRRV